MCAVDLPGRQFRDQVIADMREAGVLVLGCGTRSIRFRPALDVTVNELTDAVAALDVVLQRGER